MRSVGDGRPVTGGQVGPPVVTRLGNTHDQGVALAAAAAQRRRADAAAAPLQLQRQVQDDPGAGHADRVARGRWRRR